MRTLSTRIGHEITGKIEVRAVYAEAIGNGGFAPLMTKCISVRTG